MTRSVEFHDIFSETELEEFGINKNLLGRKSILVTGSRGMLGGALSAVLSHMIYSGHLNSKLFLASRSWDDYEILNRNESVSYISNAEARSHLQQFDVIIHCASPSNITKVTTFEEIQQINKDYLGDCITTKTSKIIFISSGEIYGGKSTSVHSIIGSFDSLQRRNWYPIAKLKSEAYLKEKYLKEGISVDVIRLFHTFGPGIRESDGRSFADIVYGAANSRKIVLKSRGEQVRSFLYLGDAVRAILLCLNQFEGYRILNVGSPEPTSIYEFASLVGEMSESNIEFLPVKFEHSPYDSIVPDISQTQTIGWEPKVGLREAIDRTLTWIKG